jgi:putative membrane protein
MLWIKAIHIFAVVSWFAGLLYLPRLFVYHVETKDAEGNLRFQTMEKRLYYGIMTLAMIFTLVTGIWLLMIIPGYLNQGWMHAKLMLVACVIIFHIYCGTAIRAFKHNKNTRSGRFYRIINEIPAVLLLGIVILVVVKPF